MNKINLAILSLIVLMVLAAGAIVSILFLQRKQPQTIPSRATDLSCRVDSAFCSFSSDDTATSFKVEIIDKSTGEKIVSKTTPDKTVYFTSKIGHTYECSVIPINACGQGSAASGQTTCFADTTPIPTPTDTPPTPTPTVPEDSPTPTLTPPPDLTQTPTSSPQATSTPPPQSCAAKSCDNTSNPCASGLICIQANDGSNYCTLPEFQDACRDNPGESTCCTAPTVTQSAEATSLPVSITSTQTSEIPSVGEPIFIKIFGLISIAVIFLGLVL